MRNGMRFRILPLLILVAFLSFSVRLMDAVTGFSTLSGAAMASAKKEKAALGPDNPRKDMTEKHENASHEEQSADTTAQNNAAQELDHENAAHEIHADSDDAGHGNAEDSKWRDSFDEELTYSDVNSDLLEELTKRRRDVLQKEKQIKTREALLRAADQELERKYQELLQLRAQIEELLGHQKEEEENQIISLVKVYEGMKAADAARIFNTLDLDVLVAVISRMSERKLSPILANMNPERARTITIMLAEQKKLPTLPDQN